MRHLILILATLCATSAYAACPTAPATNPTDMIIRFKAPSGEHAGTMSASFLTNKTAEGTLLYDTAAKTLKICDDTEWLPLAQKLGGTAGNILINNGNNQITHTDAFTFLSNRLTVLGDSASQGPQHKIYSDVTADSSSSWIELWPGQHTTRSGELTLAGTYIAFRTNSTDTELGTTNMVLAQTGNLGLGLGTPAQKLEIRSGSLRISENNTHKYFDLAYANAPIGTSCATACGTKHCLGGYNDNTTNTKTDCTITTANRNCICIGR